jgi:hypothetical protein
MRVERRVVGAAVVNAEGLANKLYQLFCCFHGRLPLAAMASQLPAFLNACNERLSLVDKYMREMRLGSAFGCWTRDSFLLASTTITTSMKATRVSVKGKFHIYYHILR